jgi:endonuclease YncB( thermonuclease family)
MSFLRTTSKTWVTGTSRVTWLAPPREATWAVHARTFGFVAVATVFGLILMASAPRAEKAKLVEIETGASPKDAARLASAGRSDVAEPPGPTGPGPRPDPAAPSSLFDPRVTAQSKGFSPWGEATASTDRFARVEARPVEDWTEREFSEVAVLDGRTLLADRTRIRLIGLDLPMPEQVCRTLDQRLEACAARAATQLELLTRWRRVTCHYRLEGADEAIGRCRVGTSDLTERMVKSGYTWRSAEALPQPQT